MALIILQRFGPGRLLLRPLDRQPGDLHGFDLQRAALQRGGGIEIFVNFAGGAVRLADRDWWRWNGIRSEAALGYRR